MKGKAFFGVFIILLACNPSGLDKKQEILALKEMSTLASVEYVVTRIIKADDNQTWYKIGDRKILMSCRASFKAGVDFSKITSDKIKINNKEISLVLTPAELLYINIKPEDIKVEYEEVGTFRSNFSADEKNQLMIQAERQLKNSTESLGILQTAETNASLFLTNFLRNLGYEKIDISYDRQASPRKMN